MRFTLSDLAVPIIGRRWPAVQVLQRWRRPCPTPVVWAHCLPDISPRNVSPRTSLPPGRSPAGRWGVNLFVPQPCRATSDQLDAYRDLLGPLARRLGVEPGGYRPDDDGWRAKLDVVAAAAPEAVSFTFGCPDRAVLARLRSCGVLTMVTVSSRAEAESAVASGADALVVQGPSAGGHRSVFDPDRQPRHCRCRPCWPRPPTWVSRWSRPAGCARKPQFGS